MATNADLEKRLNSVFEAQKSKIAQFQQDVGKESTALQERYRKFEALRDRLRETVFQPRLEILQKRFPQAVLTPTRGRDVGSIVLSVGRTTDIPASVELRLHFRHDGRVQSVILEYELSIRPAYTDFERSARYEAALDKADDNAIAAWLDDRIVQFTQTYLSLRFVNEYQKDVLVTDPVAQVRFPKGFAKATRDHGGETLYFASDESVKLFDQNPSAYLGGAPQGEAKGDATGAARVEMKGPAKSAAKGAAKA